MVITGALSLAAAVVTGALVSNGPAAPPPFPPLPQLHSCPLPAREQVPTSTERS